MKNTPETKIYYFAEGKVYHLPLEDYLREYFPGKWEKGGFDSAFYAATNGMPDAPTFYEDLAELYEGMGYSQSECQFMASTTFFEGISATPAQRFLDVLEACFEKIEYSKQLNRYSRLTYTLTYENFMDCVDFHEFLEGAQDARVLPFIEGVFMTDYKYPGKELHVSFYQTSFGSADKIKYLVDVTIF